MKTLLAAVSLLALAGCAGSPMAQYQAEQERRDARFWAALEQACSSPDSQALCAAALSSQAGPPSVGAEALLPWAAYSYGLESGRQVIVPVEPEQRCVTTFSDNRAYTNC